MAKKYKQALPGNGSSLVAFQRVLRENVNMTPEFEPGVTELTLEEVMKHSTRRDCWTVYRGIVYNLTPFISHHPGGIDEVMKGAGRDCTALYDKYHPWVNIDAILKHLRLGPLVASKPADTKAALDRIREDPNRIFRWSSLNLAGFHAEPDGYVTASAGIFSLYSSTKVCTMSTNE